MSVTGYTKTGADAAIAAAIATDAAASAKKDLSNVDPATGRTRLDVPSTESLTAQLTGYASLAGMPKELVQNALGRGGIPATSARLDGLRVLPGLNSWLRHPIGNAALLVIGDSTGATDGLTDGGPWPPTSPGAYVRWTDRFAQMLAAQAGLDININILEWDGINGNLYYEGPRSLRTGSQGVSKLTFPGTPLSCYYWPKNGSTQLSGSHWFFSEWVTPSSWAPGSTYTLISDFGNDGAVGFQFYLNSTGNLVFRWSPTGLIANLITRTSTVVVPGVTGTPLWCGVDVNLNNGSGQYVITFYTSTDGHNWTPLGTPFTTTGSTSIFQTGNRYELGSRTNGGVELFAGDILGVQARIGGMYGPTFLPTQPDQWYPDATGVRLSNYAPTLTIVNGSWQGKGLDQFDDPTNLPLMVPHYPYLAVIVNTAHNDPNYLGRNLTDKWDAVMARILRRAPDAEVAVLTQNPRVASLGALYATDHEQRISQIASYARNRGFGVIDTYQEFLDQPDFATDPSRYIDPAGNPYGGVHPKGDGVNLQAQKIWDEVVA